MVYTGGRITSVDARGLWFGQTGRVTCRFRKPAMIIGAWRSLAARLLWEQKVVGSSPTAPTKPRKALMDKA